MIMSVDRAANSRIEADLVRTFRNRPSSDALLVLGGNGTLLILTAILFVDDVPGLRMWSWLGAVLATTLLRAGWRLRGGRSPLRDAAFLASSRAVVAMQALSWGVGAALVMPWMNNREMAIFIAGLAGVIGSALNTLSADSRSFRVFALGICVPMLPGILAASTDQPHLVMAALVIAFATAMLVIHDQSHKALVEHLRTVARLEVSERTQAKLIADLRAALGAVKQLTGLLPICANCKKVRDDFGYWNSVEHYISEHTDAKFSHGICPDCFPKLFPGIPLPEPEEEHV